MSIVVAIEAIDMKKPYPDSALRTVLVIASMAVLASCSKHLNTSASLKTNDSDSLKAQKTVLVSRPLVLDSMSFANDKFILPAISDTYYNSKVKQKVMAFYKADGYLTKWLYDNKTSPLFDTAFNAMKSAAGFGLDPATYDVDGIAARVHSLYQSDTIAEKSVRELELHFSEMFFLFTTHLNQGRMKSVPNNGKSVWKREGGESSSQDAALVAAATSPAQLVEAIALIQPQDEQYRKLHEALFYYQNLDNQTRSTFTAISVKSGVKPGERNAAIPLIRKKLSITDMKVYPMPYDSVKGAFDSLSYDETLVSGVKLFQHRHGLQPDGVIGEKTLRFMNQSFREKADIIALNMERSKWLPNGHGEDYIAVNVPEFMLRAYEQGQKALEMRVIVGLPAKATPIFNDELEHIVFSPTWTVPTSIIKEEIIPNLRKDSLHYANKNFLFFKNDEEIDPIAEVWTDTNINPYQYRVVQNPGTDNSLGSVKFMMPNNMSIYLHDTPSRRLFQKDYRALSHGCVRLGEPAKFAEFLLKDQKGWNAQRITKAMNESSPATVHLKKHYPVFIEYRTAWVDDDGLINFREDIYGHDKLQLKQLKPVLRPSAASIGM